MASKTRLLGYVLSGAIVLAITACAEPHVTVCGTTGVLCPVGYHCAAAQDKCIKDTQGCGDLQIDRSAGEVCDDGNNVDGDGCSADCKSDESCSNGKVDKPFPENPKDPRNEDCEPPGQMDRASGFFCKATCKFAFCGNGVTDTDIGEICDDGNTVGGDGCSANCKSTELCGNGILDQPIKDANGVPDLDNPQNEVCDDHNTNDGDGCSSDCRSTEACGNGRVDPGEECDDGAANNGDDKDCRSDCVINRCGDGHPNTAGVLHREQCDAGLPVMDTGGNPIPAPIRSRAATPREADNCNIDCTIPQCGDSKVNHSFKPDGVHGEQCDNGASNNDDADCTANCQVSVCGDNLHNTAGPAHAEGCDDGNRVDSDECNNACVARSCGDGILNPNAPANEQCDNGALNSDTGSCLTNCRTATCGDGHTEAGVEECDNGAANGTVGNPCSSTCRNRTCGNGIIDPGEECDNGAANSNSGNCRLDCIVNRCGDGYINNALDEHGQPIEQCEGLTPPVPFGSHSVTPVETIGCNLNCTFPACGDGILNRHFVPTRIGGGLSDTPEQCDDGARVNGDSCSRDCQFERCGNGIPDPGEECDHGSANGTIGDTCSATCHTRVCGNGILDPNEECDDAANNGNDKDCRSDCVVNRCGDGFPNLLGSLTHREVCDEATQAAPGDRAVSPINTNTCNANCKAATCGDSFVNPVHKVAPPLTLTEQCDPPGPGCSATCRIQNCGNGVVDPGEQCDDGNAVNTDSCTNQCTNARCGDGFEQSGEECDDGNSINTDACTNDCKDARCGDGFTQPGEDCDQPLASQLCPYQPTEVNCQVCDSNCDLVPGQTQFCGNGIVDVGSPEICEPNECGACNPDCRSILSRKATGLILAAAGDQYRTMGNLDTFVLHDGVINVTFEFTPPSGGSGLDANEPIAFTPTDTAAEVADSIATAIGNTNLRIATRVVGGAVLLTHTRLTSTGNVDIDESVQSAQFAVDGMSGGLGGGCAATHACTSGVECQSNQCSSGQCTTP